MTTELPKIKLLYYKNLLDNCFKQFFKDFNDDFVNDNGRYAYASSMSECKLKRIFKQYLKDELRKYVLPNSTSNHSYYFIIGSCLPKDNILLQFANDNFPVKLRRLIDADCRIKYFLKEHDIQLDLTLFNAVFDLLFNELFSSLKKIMRFVGEEYTNLFFIRHSKLDCLTIYDMIRAEFGKSNIVNLHKLFFEDSKVIIYSVNECIDKHILNKRRLSEDTLFQLIVEEVVRYVNECIRIANGKKQTKDIVGI